MLVETRPIDSIHIKDRVRKDLGDLGDLMASMQERGLINPVTITAKGVLVAGERRLEAARRLGWLEIETHIWQSQADAEELFHVEQEENTCRKPLTMTEAERTWQQYQELLRANGAGQRGRGDSKSNVNPGQRPDFSGDVRDEAAKAVGYGSTTLRRVAEVRETAEDEAQPEEVRQVAKEEYAALEAGTTSAQPAAERVRTAKKRGENLKEMHQARRERTRKNMLPGQTLKSDEPKPPPKPTDWTTQVWEVITKSTGHRALVKLTEELEVATDTDTINSKDIDSWAELLQTQIRRRQNLRKVLLQIKKG